MKYKSAILTAASGSVGGLTFSHNSGGLYTRARSIPVNTNTSQQQVVRNAMSICVAAYTDPEGDVSTGQWENYANEQLLPDAFGDPRQISGLAQFVRSMVPRIQAGLAIVNAGPMEYILPTMTLPTVTVASAPAAINVTFTNADAWANEAGGALLVYCSRPQMPSVNFFAGPYRYCGKIPGATPTPPTSPAAVTPAFAPVADMVTHVAMRITRADGRLSSMLRFRYTAN